MNIEKLLKRQSLIELSARERAVSLLDKGTEHELLGPFDHIESNWLAIQNVTPQADDGCTVMQGRIAGKPVVVCAIEGAFQGGSIGEVSGAKISTALELAARDSEKGIATSAVLFLETGGVRLQEANLGLAAIAEIMAEIMRLRRYAPVIVVTAGTVGCFGGMSLAAGLSSYLIMTREARLGMNGPEVIEQEAGIEEIDSKDRELIWKIYGGEARKAMGMIDALVADDAEEIAATVRRFVTAGLPAVHRSEQLAPYWRRVTRLNAEEQWRPEQVHEVWSREENA